jgi:hypothetical protein
VCANRGDGMNSIARHFGERERQRLEKIFRQLGTDNPHESEVARAAIDGLLRQFGKMWPHLIYLLGGRLDDLISGTSAIHADLARDIAALGSGDPEERASARRNLVDRLERHRKTWNDLVDVLCSGSPEAWACKPIDDVPRIDPLALVHRLLQEYTALRPHEYLAVALWALHTHVYDRFMETPRLVLRSPVGNAGKTTLLSVLEKLTARGKKYDSITTAAIIRRIDQRHSTVLIDEADNLGIELRENGRLRALFNSGHRKGGTFSMVERGREREYSTFAPLAMALPIMFGGLPRTLNSRSITIMMERDAEHRKLKRFDANHPDHALDAAYEQILLWRGDVELDSDPEMSLRTRFADNWRALISIADALGWGEQAREVMTIFSREYRDADVKIILLVAIRQVFDTCQADCLPTKDLLDALYALDEAEWCEFRGLRGDQQPHKLRWTELASMLREFGIKSRTIWPPNRTATSRSAKGYRREQFEEVWRKYCDDGTSSQPSNIRHLRLAGDGTS